MNKELIFKYPEDEFWLGEIHLKEMKIDRSGIISTLFRDDHQKKMATDPELMKQDIKIENFAAHHKADDMGVLNALEKHKEQIRSFKNIEMFNQLGIKDYLTGKVDFAKLHTRYAHSVGTALIGRLYFNAIAPFIKYTIFKKLGKSLEELLSFSLYLHDVGHFPYSHLIEEVFNEINWSRAKDQVHFHDISPLEQLPPEEKDGIKKTIADCLHISCQEEIEQSFDFVSDAISGTTGIPFIDAIVNSSLDADKIDYLFRDMKYSERSTRISKPDEWLSDFFSHISLSAEGLVRLNGRAAECALELLAERQFLYEKFYFDPKIRAFEKIAATIIGCWLTKEFSKRFFSKEVDLIEENHSTQEGGIFLKACTPDYRKIKGDLAYKWITEKFLEKEKDLYPEMALLIDMCENLGDDKTRDDISKNWFKNIGKRLRMFQNPSSDRTLDDEYKEMIVRAPFLIKNGVKKAREIARNIFVDFPCGILIDISEYPRFLPSSKYRRFRISNTEIIGETFLVPDRDPEKWKGGKEPSKFPLHCCDFSRYEKKHAQVVMVNTMPEEQNGDFFYELFIKRCINNGIELEIPGG